jgi:hypothetical protein
VTDLTLLILGLLLCAGGIGFLVLTVGFWIQMKEPGEGRL